MFSGRHLSATAFAFFGTTLVGVALVVMNARAHRPKEVTKGTDIEFVAQAQKKKKQETPKPKPKPKPKRASRRRAPAPNIASNLGSLGGGLAVFSAADLAGLGNDVIASDGDLKDMVMTADTVDQKPGCENQPLPIPPNRAVRRGITGEVVVRALMNTSGRLEGLRIVRSEPEGVYDNAVLSALKNWICQPATYGGEAVAMSYELIFPFR